MKYKLDPDHWDLATPDGVITKISHINETTAEADVLIESISPLFVGYDIDRSLILFNIKSTLAQIGVDADCREFELNKKNGIANVSITLRAIGPQAIKMLPLIQVGTAVGKLFAADDRRRVRDPYYLSRMFGRSDRWGRPLLSLGGLHGSEDLILDKVEGRTVAYLALQNGRVRYDEHFDGFIPTVAKALNAKIPIRGMLSLHQDWVSHSPKNVSEGELLLVKTLPLHIRTVFARVIDDLLTEGYRHTSASVLQPDTQASGDIYELFGDCKRELTDIPLEFYTLEPYREHVFFADRDQLQECIEDPNVFFKAFESAPEPTSHRAAVFVVKGDQLCNLKPEDWISQETHFLDLPGFPHGRRQAIMIENYIQQQPSYPFLKAIDDTVITSQGILLSRYFPTPLMERMLLTDQVVHNLKGLYFERPSLNSDDFFSHEDRAFLHDLYKFALPVYWVDRKSEKILQYIEQQGRDSGMFVPLDQVNTFLNATMFGIYGSNLLEGRFEQELNKLLTGILEMRDHVEHELLHKDKPLALVTGGGPGAMAVGNRVAKELGVLSCANIVDFGGSDAEVINEQRQNPFVDAKMTYRLDKLVERQAEFNLDFPIFLTGGIGTDFEYTLEEVRRKVGATPPNPIILFGTKEYWKKKITSRFHCNLEKGTIKGSEWVSNCFYAVESSEEGLEVYRQFFEGTLPIGKDHPSHEDGFVSF